jgi:hypothetical protein
LFFVTGVANLGLGFLGKHFVLGLVNLVAAVASHTIDLVSPTIPIVSFGVSVTSQALPGSVVFAGCSVSAFLEHHIGRGSTLRGRTGTLEVVFTVAMT